MTPGEKDRFEGLLDTISRAEDAMSCARKAGDSERELAAWEEIREARQGLISLLGVERVP